MMIIEKLLKLDLEDWIRCVGFMNGLSGKFLWAW